jgi:hypothetical protein
MKRILNELKWFLIVVAGGTLLSAFTLFVALVWTAFTLRLSTIVVDTYSMFVVLIVSIFSVFVGINMCRMKGVFDAKNLDSSHNK